MFVLGIVFNKSNSRAMRSRRILLVHYMALENLRAGSTEGGL
jgi:hypothetical protein